MNEGDTLADLARQHDVYVGTDSPFQRRARLLQALWREERGLPVGLHRGRPLGSRIAMPEARDGLLNYLTDRIRDVVQREVLDHAKAKGRLYAKPRIFNDLLSSQPLCFNLFGEQAIDLDIATRALRRRVPGLARVTAIEFEWSPGRGDDDYTGDRSAFDVFVAYATRGGGAGFVGVEVKYHENLRDRPAAHKARYDEVAAGMGCFRPDHLPALREAPLQQLWRDHLLAGAMLQAADLGFDEGRFVVLYPRDNTRCAEAVAAYQEGLSDPSTFGAWTLESLLEDLRAVDAGPWVEAFRERYLAWERIEA